MPGENEYDPFIDEISEIKKGLRKSHRMGISGPPSEEMVQLRDRTDELDEALADGDEKKRGNKLKEAFKASLHYEMCKREDVVDHDWEPSSVMGRERINAARRLRSLVVNYFPEIADQAINEFRKEKKNHPYSEAANAVSDFAQGEINKLKWEAVEQQRDRLNGRRRNLELNEENLDKYQNELDSQKEEFEKSRKEEKKAQQQERLKEITDGIHKRHIGSVAGLPSSEMRKLRKAEASMEKVLKNADGNVNDPKVVQKMKAAYLASLHYELEKRKGDAKEEWMPSTEMGKVRMDGARNLRSFIAENHPELAEEANREFIEKNKGGAFEEAAKTAVSYTDKTIADNKERLIAEQACERAELARKQKALDRKRSVQAGRDNDLKKTDKLDEISKGLNAVHRGGASGAASSEMRSLRAANDHLKKALQTANGNVNDPAVLDAMRKAYKESLNYEVQKREKNDSPDWQPKTQMGNTRLQASRELRQFVTDYCPDIAQRAAQEFSFENRGKKYDKTVQAVVNADKTAIDLGMMKLQSDLKKAETELDIRQEALYRRRDDIRLQKSDFELEKAQESLRKQRLETEAQRKREHEKLREGLFAKRKGPLNGKASDEMKELRQADHRMNSAVNAAGGDLKDPKAEAAMMAAYKASLKYELLKRKNDAGASWTPGTDMGKRRMESARAMREYIAAKRPDLAEKAGNEFLRDNKDHQYAKSLNAVVNYTKPIIKDAYEQKKNETEPLKQAEFEARRERIAQARSRIEEGLITCERVKAQMSGQNLELKPERKSEFDKQQQEIDKQKNDLLRRQGEIELRPDADLPEINAQVIQNEPENAKDEEPHPEKEQPEEQPEVIKNAENIGDLENAVIINHEVVEKAPEKKDDEIVDERKPEDKKPEEQPDAVKNDGDHKVDIGEFDLDHVVIVDEENGEVIEEIGGEKKPEAVQPAKQQEGIKNAENIGDLENAVIINHEVVEKAPEKKDDEIVGEQKPEKKPEPVQPKAEDQIEKAEPEIKAQPEPEKPKTPEQRKYEKLLQDEKEAVMGRLSAFAEDRKNGVEINKESYKKTVADALAVEKLQSLYDEKGQMFEKTFSKQEQLYAQFNAKDAHFERFTSMREPEQFLERMKNNESLSAEMGKERYNPALTLKGFVKIYKDRELSDLSKTEFEEMVQDSKVIMRDDIRRSAGKVSDEVMNEKLAVFAAFHAISPTDPKTGQLKENGKVHRLRSYHFELDDVLGEDGLSAGKNNPAFKSLVKKFGTEKLTEMALDGSGQKLSAEFIQASVKQKADEKTFEKQKATEMKLQPKMEMGGMKKK